MLRISRGPCRAPGRLVVPPSHGTPTRAMSSFAASRCIGSRMKVATSPKRGTTMPESGSGNLSGMPHYRPMASAGEEADGAPLSLRHRGSLQCLDDQRATAVAGPAHRVAAGEVGLARVRPLG